MLTSMFYYDHYRPYIVKPEGQSEKSRIFKLKSAPEAASKGTNEKAGAEASHISPEVTDVARNVAFNKDVVDYARGIYRNVTDLKYTSKKLASDIRNYSKYKDFEEFDQEVFEGNFNNDLDSFTKSFNSSLKFLNSQEHSEKLENAAQKFVDLTDKSEKILGVMGIKKNENGELTIDPEENSFWNGRKIEKKIEAAEKLFGGINSEASELLNNPMSAHMGFKKLNYYYNYEVDKVSVDTFQIIKTGLLVNLAL